MFKTRFISMLVLLAAVATGAWAQTYTVTFSGARLGGSLNEAINNVTMPYSFSAVNGQNLSPRNVIDEYGVSYTNVYVSSGGEGKVSVSYTSGNMTITISGAFEGTATIHCEGLDDIDDGISRDVHVTCVENKVNVTGVTLSQTEAAMTVGGDALTLTATVAPDNAADKTVTWTTSDASVATVADGVVTAVAPGTATITATATNGTADTSDDKTATCEVTVSPAGYSVALKEGTDDAANWQGKAGEGEYQSLPLTGLEAGTAVSFKYSGTKHVKSVKAKRAAPANVPVESITLNKTATKIAVGQTETLSVTEVLPANATDPTYTWKTSDETKATVDQDGKVTAVAAGNVNIYAEANDGSGVSATCAVTVTLTYPIALSAVTADYIGSVITSDGNVYPAKTAVPDGCTAVGILGKVTETGHGLILALKNATSQTWNTINGWESVTAYAGTTLKVLPDDGARGVNLTSYTTLGTTAVSNWAVAQKSDYEAIFINLGSKAGDEDGTTYDGNVNAFITTGVGGTELFDDYYYWSATENGDDAWNFGSDYWSDNNKTGSYRVRPVLGF